MKKFIINNHNTGTSREVSYSKPQHTATPWRICPYDSNLIQTVKEYTDDDDDIGRYCIARILQQSDETKANAEFIVKACNNHDALVEALRTCSNALASLGGKSGSYEVEKARNALAQVEKG